MSERDWLPAPVHAAGIERTLKAGQSLFRQGTRTVGLYEVVSGKVQLARVDRSGREVILYSASAGARQVMDLRTRLEQRNIHSARERIRHYLTLNLGADGRSVPLAGTLKDLAANLGLSHEALYRTLAEMQKDGEIERLKGRVRLLRRV